MKQRVAHLLPALTLMMLMANSSLSSAQIRWQFEAGGKIIGKPTIVENPELLCLPSIKYLPEPGALLSLGSGLMLLGWLERRRKRRAIGP